MLTSAQLTTLKNDIAANTATVLINGAATAINAVPLSPDNCQQIANWYNGTAAPDYWVWKSFVADQDIYNLTVETLTWSWTIFIGRSQGERDAWRQLVNMAGGLNPSLTQVRTGIADIFSGAGGLNQRNFLLALGRRLATRIEKLLATGSGTTASPSLMGFESPVVGSNVLAAMQS